MWSVDALVEVMVEVFCCWLEGRRFESQSRLSIGKDFNRTFQFFNRFTLQDTKIQQKQWQSTWNILENETTMTWIWTYNLFRSLSEF